MKQSTDGNDLIAAIKEFEAVLPGWWWTLGSCGVTRDASCGPPRASCGPDYSSPDVDKTELKFFDNGFHCDDSNGTVASSLRSVMHQALEAKAELSNNRPAAVERYVSTLVNQRGYSHEHAIARAREVLAHPNID